MVVAAAVGLRLRLRADRRLAELFALPLVSVSERQTSLPVRERWIAWLIVVPSMEILPLMEREIALVMFQTYCMLLAVPPVGLVNAGRSCSLDSVQKATAFHQGPV